jgi:HD superfamily phosphodiesterase
VFWLAAASIAVSAYSKIAEGNAEAEALESKSYFSRLQNAEYQRKVKFNIENQEAQLNQTIGSIRTKSAGVGIDVGSGASLQAIRSAMINTSKNITEIKTSAAYQNKISNLESISYLTSALDTQSASRIGAVSGILSGASKLQS